MAAQLGLSSGQGVDPTGRGGGPPSPSLEAQPPSAQLRELDRPRRPVGGVEPGAVPGSERERGCQIICGEPLAKARRPPPGQPGDAMSLVTTGRAATLLPVGSQGGPPGPALGRGRARAPWLLHPFSDLPGGQAGSTAAPPRPLFKGAGPTGWEAVCRPGFATWGYPAETQGCPTVRGAREGAPGLLRGGGRGEVSAASWTRRPLS